MISVYMRLTPQIARAVYMWQDEVRKVAADKGVTPHQAHRFMPAMSARACANAIFDAKVIPPMMPSATETEAEILTRVEIEQLQLEPAVFRQRIVELEQAHAREREQHATDLARVVAERDEARTTALLINNEAGLAWGDKPGEVEIAEAIERYRKETEA